MAKPDHKQGPRTHHDHPREKGLIAILTLNRPDAMNALGEPGDGAAERDACKQAITGNLHMG